MPAQLSAEAQFQDVRLTHILGMTVEDPNAQELGVVKDLALDARAARPEYLIVGTGGFLGWGARERALPAQDVSAATIIRGTLDASLPQAEWEKAPDFASENAALAQPVGKAKLPLLSRGPESGAPQPGHQDPAGLQSARSLLGKVVLDAQHQKLGEVTDLLVDLSGQRPLVVIVCARRFLHPDLRCAVPLPLLGLAGDKLLLGTNRRHLEQAPWLTERSWQATTRHQAPAIYRVAGAT